jgi:predicted HTH domain antitoxin
VVTKNLAERVFTDKKMDGREYHTPSLERRMSSARVYIMRLIYIVLRMVSLSETISLRLPRETIKKLRELADKEGKDRSALIREILENGVKEKNIDHAVELYRTGQITGWKAAQLAEVSLWNFYKILAEKGVLIQYSEHDLEEDLKV